MEAQTDAEDENNVRSLYNTLLENWNSQNASAFANLFARNGIAIGFDGSQMIGLQEIYDEISKVFSSHKVSTYVGIVREVRALSTTVFLLHSVAGMVPPEESKINPDVNAVQILIAKKDQGKFRIAVYQNTPAAFHGRTELSQQLTEELQEAFNNQPKKTST